jgi:hypothetical protein
VRWEKNKKQRVGLSVGFLVLSIFRFSVLSQWFTFQFSVCRFCFLHLAVTVGGMASKGLRANHLSSYRKADAGYCASHTDETLIGYTACCVAFLFISPYLYSSHILSFLNTDFSNIHSKLNPAFSSTLCEALLKSKTPV